MDQNFINIATDNLTLPHDVVQLPSGGLFYKSKKKSIKVGYLTANDENILINSLNNNRDNVVLQLVRNKVYEHDLRPEDLLPSDIEAILIFLRNTSFGPEYKLKMVDPKTSKPFEVSFFMEELNIKKCPNKPNSDGTFEVVLPKSNATVKIRPLTFGENLELDSLEEKYPVGTTVPKITLRLTKQIEELNGETDKGKIALFVNNMPIMDSKFIKNFLFENTPSLELKREIKAPSGELVTAEITFGVEFFRPFF